MEINDAIRELQRASYRPGWTFWYSAGYTPGSVHVDYEADVPNSSPPWTDPRPRVVTEGSYSLPVGLARNVEELHRMNLDAIIREAETHEAREFYRVDGQAPFHPHRLDGRARWDRRERVAA